jgi:enoyl-CoA hydratase/carnithine racemase
MPKNPRPPSAPRPPSRPPGDAVLLSERRGAVAWLTLQRPARLNALNYALVDALAAELAAIEADPAVRAVILTGAGRAFSAGADIDEFSRSVAEGPEAALRDFVARGQALTAWIEAFPKPVIAAVNGLAYGGGCEIVEAAHLAIAADGAVFAKPEITLGMPPTFGGTQRLPRLAGRKRALHHLLTGDPFQAEQALAMGLVNAVVPADELTARAEALAGRILRHGPLAVRAVLGAATRGLNMAIAEGLAMEAAAFATVARSADLAEGLDAWRARRPPRFTGR